MIGIILIPIWIFGVGQWLSGKYFKTLSCKITNKNLKFSKGLIIHIEKTIPIENIQDLSFVGGPILRSFGLTMIKIETAGDGGQNNQNMMSMLGINDSESFKTEILLQRERVILEKQGNSIQNNHQISDTQLLIDIKNELIEIKNKIKG